MVNIMTIFRLDGADSHYAMDSDGSSPDETVDGLITGFRATLSKLGKEREFFERNLILSISKKIIQFFRQPVFDNCNGVSKDDEREPRP